MAVLMNHSGRAAIFEPGRQSGKKFPDRKSRKQRHDKACLAREAKRPGDSHRRPFIGSLGDICVMADQPAKTLTQNIDEKAATNFLRFRPRRKHPG